MTARPDAALRRAIIETARAMNTSGLNDGTSGNVSARTAGGFLITPSGVAYGAMTPRQIVAMDMDGAHTAALAPSSEWRMHQAIYRGRPQAMAVVHCHSDHAAALSCLRRGIPAFHYMIARFGGANLRCARYATFGTEALSKAMMKALAGRSACLLANHGQIVFGASLDHALSLAREVETLCRHYAIALQAGAPTILGNAEMDEVLARFATYGQPKA